MPQQLQRAMAAEAEAGREAKAKVIAAEGEQRAARALKDASGNLSNGFICSKLLPFCKKKSS